MNQNFDFAARSVQLFRDLSALIRAQDSPPTEQSATSRGATCVAGKLRRIVGVLALGTAAVSGSAAAVDQVYLQASGVVRPSGDSYDGETGLGWVLPWQWVDGKLTSRLNLGLGYTHGKERDAGRLLATPVLRYQPSVGRGVFGELGVGLAYFSSEQWATGHDMGSHLQFDNRLGLGYGFERSELSLNFTHYSNGGLKDPNPGTDTVGLRWGYRF